MQNSVRSYIKKATANGRLLPAIAIGSVYTWNSLAFRAAVAPQFSFQVGFLSHPRMDESWLSALVVVPVGLVLLWFFTRHLPMRFRPTSSVLAVIGAVLMCAGTIPMTLFVVSVQSVAIGGATGGLGFMLYLSARLPYLFGKSGKELALTMVFACLFSLIFALLILLLIRPAAIGALMILPIVSLLSSFAAHTEVTETQLEQRLQRQIVKPHGFGRSWHSDKISTLTPFVTFTVLNFCMGIIGFNSDSLNNEEFRFQQVGFLIGGLTLALLILIVLRRFGGHSSLKFVIPVLIATLMLLLPISQNSSFDFLIPMIVLATLYCAGIMIIFVLRDSAQGLDAPTARIQIACVLSAIAFLSLSGILAGGAIRSVFGLDQIALSLAAITVLYLVFLVFIVFARNKQTVEHVLAGAIVGEEEVAKARCSIIAELHSSLSARELEVLYFLLQNYSNARIGNALVISENTVKTHVKHIYTKLGIQTRQQLFELASSIKITN